ncbi:MAG: hypothetical protein Q9M92_11565 [Enterobacterales bacterium]|nr:hypothetical protein [Enterobacterales bacterium]
MTKNNTQQNEQALAHAKYKKLILMTLGAFLISLIVGGVGGYLIWDSLKPPCVRLVVASNILLRGTKNESKI